MYCVYICFINAKAEAKTRCTHITVVKICQNYDLFSSQITINRLDRVLGRCDNLASEL